jgi:hypothetical protein
MAGDVDYKLKLSVMWLKSVWIGADCKLVCVFFCYKLCCFILCLPLHLVGVNDNGRDYPAIGTIRIVSRST